MVTPRHIFLLLTGLTALFSGCATTPAPLADDEYQPPVSTAGRASLKGSRLTEGGLFGEVHTGYIYMIDLKSVRDAAAGWETPIALAPGKHTVMAEYRFSNFKARATLQFAATPGASYQLMIKHGRESTTEVKLFCEFWVIDTATGQTVSKVQHAQVMGGKKGTIFNVPT